MKLFWSYRQISVAYKKQKPILHPSAVSLLTYGKGLLLAWALYTALVLNPVTPKFKRPGRTFDKIRTLRSSHGFPNTEASSNFEKKSKPFILQDTRKRLKTSWFSGPSTYTHVKYLFSISSACKRLFPIAGHALICSRRAVLPFNFEIHLFFYKW